MNYIKLFLIGLTVSMLIFFGGYRINCQHLQTALEKEIEPTILNGNLYQICAGLADAGVPVGLEGNFLRVSSSKTIRLSKGRLIDILNSIVLQAPDYQWESNDGVVNIFPKRSRDEQIGRFLELKISTFDVSADGGRKQVADQINRLAQKAEFSKSKPKLFVGWRTYPGLKDGTVDISLSGVSFRSLLNKIVLTSSDSRFWFINRESDDTISLTF